MANTRYRIGDLDLDLGTREVWRSGTLIPLPSLSFDLLVALMRHAPNLATVRELEQEVWTDLVVSPSTVAKRVALLRSALEDHPEDPRYIAVVRGHGYRLLVPVSVADETEFRDRGQRRKQSDNPVRVWVAGLLAAVMIIVVVIVMNQPNQGFNRIFKDSATTIEAASESAGEPRAGVLASNSIAVLPFVSLRGSEDDQYVADGITEEIINLLATIPSLRVMARTSSFAFRDSTETVRSIAGKLGVSYIVEGSLQLEEDTIRVTAQLIDARTGFHLWSEKFDREFTQVFAIQDEIAGSIVTALEVVIGQNNPSRQLTNSADAYAHYLKARAMLHQRLALGRSALEDSVSSFMAALDIDPEFTQAWAGLSAARFLNSSHGYPAASGDNRLAVSAALNALELDSNNPEANAVLGAVNWRRGSFETSKTYFDHALKHPVADSNVRLWAGVLLQSVGLTEDSYALLSDANKLDPLNQNLVGILSSNLTIRGESEKALQLLSSQTEHEWQNALRGKILLVMGHVEQARTLLSDLELPVGKLPARYVEQVVQATIDPSRMTVAENEILQATQSGALTTKVAYQLLWLMGSPAIFDVSGDVPVGLVAFHTSMDAWRSESSGFRRDPRFHDWALDAGLVRFWNETQWPGLCEANPDSTFRCR